MPIAIMPEIICRNKFIKEKFEIGFGGQLSLKHPFYRERTQTINYIKRHYNLKIFKNIFNYMSEEYSQCKIIFAGDPYFKDLELYASNRPYIALATGCCIITNYFKGLEKLAVNEKHLLWYTNKSELRSLLDKYLSNQELREKIKRNAAKLAKEKHNYISRITNMLDIINGKTENFYGFI
jgi:spore maturation protein CgeB